MQLTYRGIGYEFARSSAGVEKRLVACRYRGLEWNWQAQAAALTLSGSFTLIYRGMALNPSARVASGIPVGQAEMASLRVTSSQKDFIAMLEQTHRQNLMRRLQERIRSAQARGDEHLLQQLEQERQLLA